jgi:hypothetical protein
MDTSRLNKKLELWGMSDIENDLGETSMEPVKIKDIWCYIVPKHGSITEVSGAVTEESRLNLSIRCRKLSVESPSIDMFFLNGTVKYQVLDWIEDFKGKSFYEFQCRAVYE